MGVDLAKHFLVQNEWFPAMLSTLTKDRRDIRLNWLEENFGSIGESTGGDQNLQHEFWFPGYVENRRKNNNLIREGALKSLTFESFFHCC